MRAAASQKRDWRVNLLLFSVTLVTVFAAGRQMVALDGTTEPSWFAGWPFAVPFLLILLFHEFGHWVAAVIHRVPASLPYFIPLPFVGGFGTLGAVIVMPERIRSRNALLDIGAAGPLAGMLVALPTMVVGLQLSEVREQLPGGYIQEGQSLLYSLIKLCVLGPMPADHDVYLHPTAFAAWAGFLITMINLLPWGQLDGGHIAYALLGERHHRIARRLRFGLLLLFAYNLAWFALPVLTGNSQMPWPYVFGNSWFWLIWYAITGVLGRIGGHEHPPVEPGELSRGRRWVAIACLALFVLLFMPTPLAFY